MSDSLTFVGATQALALFAAFGPTPSDVRKHSPQDVSYANDLRRTEGVAGGIALALGSYIAVRTKSVEPLLLSGVMVLSLIAVYEYQLRTPIRKPLVASVVSGSEYTPGFESYSSHEGGSVND
jgi:hypothetical protein